MKTWKEAKVLTASSHVLWCNYVIVLNRIFHIFNTKHVFLTGKKKKCMNCYIDYGNIGAQPKGTIHRTLSKRNKHKAKTYVSVNCEPEETKMY